MTEPLVFVNIKSDIAFDGVHVQVDEIEAHYPHRRSGYVIRMRSGRRYRTHMTMNEIGRRATRAVDPHPAPQ